MNISISPNNNLILPNSYNQNFYQYVNQHFFDNNTIPDDKSSWGYFNILDQNSLENQYSLLENISENNHHNKLLSQFWKNCDNIYESENIPELLNFSNNLFQKSFDPNLGKFLANLSLNDVNPFLYFGSTFDLKNSNLLIAGLGFSGLTLSDKEYYLNDEHKQTRSDYQDYLQKLSDLCNIDFNFILQFETKIAEYHLNKEDKRDPHKTYNPHNLQELFQLSSTIESYIKNNTYLDHFPEENEHKINISNPTGLQKLIDLLNETDDDSLEKFVKYKIIKNIGSVFSKKIDQLNFQFFGQKINGLKKQKPIWERKIRLINSYLGELIGELYVEKYFDKSCQETAHNMVNNMIATFHKRINNLSWMEKETKEFAIKKLNKMKIKLGYPEVIEDYTNLHFSENDNLVSILQKINRWNFQLEFNEMYKPPNRLKWEMNPQSVNAYFHPLLNEIVFPAAILQPPFFDKNASPEWNYGGIGMVICHEITHAFDDKGRKFDSDGNLNDWWKESDTEKFEKIIATYNEQWSAIELEGVKIKAGLVMGEALADHGGVNVAIDALKTLYKEDINKKDENNLTPMHRFFLSVGRVWANLRTKEYTKLLTTTDPHPHPMHRVNITLANTKEFYETYGIKEDSQFFVPEEKRLTLW